MHEITYNGVKSSDLGIRIERSPEIIHPRRKYDVISVPGRNGDIVLMQDAWENYIQEYNIFFGDGTPLCTEPAANAISNWLNSANGYVKLIDTFQNSNGSYRLAYYVDEFDVENALTEYGRATIRFNCRPERFMPDVTSGVTNGQTVTNAYQYAAKPIITISGPGTWSGTFTVTNGDHVYEIGLTNIQTTVILDCEEQNARGSLGQNLNNKVTVNSGDEFPRLLPGGNVITWSLSGLAYSVQITPRFYII